MKYTTYIVDISVALHDIHFWLEKTGYNFDDPTRKSVLEDQFLWLHGLGFLPEKMIPKQARVVYAADQKTTLSGGKYHYWRYSPLSQIPLAKRKRNPETKLLETTYIDYKGGREPNPQDRYSPDRLVQNAYFVKARSLEGFNQVKQSWYDFAQRNNLEVYQLAGYEADDVAAAYTMLHPDENILLCTVDQDWIGLVNGRVSLWDIKGYQRPRLLTAQSVYEWAKGKGYAIEQASDIWKIKSVEGDSSDKLPKNTPIEYISLLEPPVEHRLWLDNRLGINTRRFVRNLPDYRIPEKKLNESFLENNVGIRCQLSTFYATMRT